MRLRFDQQEAVVTASLGLLKWHRDLLVEAPEPFKSLLGTHVVAMLGRSP